VTVLRPNAGSPRRCRAGERRPKTRLRLARTLHHREGHEKFTVDTVIAEEERVFEMVVGERIEFCRQPAIFVMAPIPQALMALANMANRAMWPYWDSFRDADQVFYGHPLGFKGLERRSVVLVVNEKSAVDRSRERLYVGLSRARDQLVLCGDPDFIREVGGTDLAQRLKLPRMHGIS
jgi:hypothetical protein